MRLFLIVSLLLAGCVRYVPAECPEPPTIAPLSLAPIEQTLPPGEQVREMTVRFGQCLEHSKSVDTALEAYRK